MKPEDAALTAVGVTLGVSALLIVYLHRVLGRVLEDTCGKPERAQFWAGCSHVLIVLVPLLVQLAMTDASPSNKSDSVSGLWLTLSMLKWGLAGLVGTVVFLAAAVGLIGKGAAVPLWVEPEHVDDMNRLMSRVREMRAREVVRKADLVED